MNELSLFRGALILAAVLEAGAGIWILRLTPAKVSLTDKIPRERYSGAVLGLLALLWCVPHARPIAFDWMQPLLYPMAVIFAVLGWWGLDYLFSRALGGMMILCAYFFVHGAFETHTPYLAGFSILYWGIGVAGICFSGKPCWMRDGLRCCCRSGAWRWGVAVYLLVTAAASLLAAIGTPGANG